jgi:hypothetical protein
MKHPLDWIPLQNRKFLFYLFLASSLGLLFLFQPVNRPLTNAAAPGGILSLQLAWTPARAQTMLDSWDAQARLFAAFGLGFDYLFMLVYAIALALGALLAAGRHPGWFDRLGAWAGGGAFLAALLDALENLGQFQQLFHGRADLAAPIGVLATLKFTLILLVLLYGLAGWLWPRPRQAR